VATPNEPIKSNDNEKIVSRRRADFLMCDRMATPLNQSKHNKEKIRQPTPRGSGATTIFPIS
jgi:hypothetical protein